MMMNRAMLAIGWIGALGMLRVAACAQNPPVSSAPVQITVHADQQGVRVSPSLYGLFFEEINHAGEGGLYAELIRNRAFQEPPEGPDKAHGLPAGWTAKHDGAQGATVSSVSPLRPELPVSLQLHLAANSSDKNSGRVAVENQGFWGIPLHEGEAYHLTLYARRDAGFKGPISVTIGDQRGHQATTVPIYGLTEQWRRFKVDLIAPCNDPEGCLRITLDHPGTVWLGAVSLMPPAVWKHRANGLRSDLAAKLAAVKPAFVRFPGGCYVEGGDHLANAYRWKSTVGDPLTRAGHRNDMWGYWSSDGLGYHEYLQLCEDLRSAPLFVVNCGISHQEVVPMDQLGPWVQDMLDAVEYANGPVSTPWGALRAKRGHPRPFGLKYIEIGNENGEWSFQKEYVERYRVFEQALKKRYPEIQTIADTTISAPFDLVDEHYYNSPDWFWDNADRYDHYGRKGPSHHSIYVGEYAVTQDCGQGNLKAALGEAAFMTGMERNSDLVRMASYAPLFVNVHSRQWNPNAIVFDAARSYATPSYYVQQLFARNRPDVTLPTELVNLLAPLTTDRGSIGLSTWNTQAEYKEIEVTYRGQRLYQADFAAGAPGWKPLRGTWSVAGAAYRQSAPGDDQRAILTDSLPADAGDYTLHLKARKLSGAEGFLVMFHTRGEGDYLWWNLGGWGNTQHAIERAAGGGKSLVGGYVPGHIETGRWYDIRIELQGPHIRCYLDDTLIQDVLDVPARHVAVVAGREDRTGDLIVKVVNGMETALDTQVNLDGAGPLRPSGEATVLTSSSLTDENALDAPTRVAPVTKRVRGVAGHFRTTFPARSVTVLRLRKG